MEVINVNSVTKSYGKREVLQGISFSVEKGEIVGILGRNGAGKTTLLRILSCFLYPSTGQVSIAGLDVTKNSLEVRRKIGYFMESVPLYRDMKVVDFLNFAAEMKDVHKNQRKEIVAKSIARCGLDQVRNVLIRKLSRGYRQRVGLSQATINEPEVIILDEPTVGLDPVQTIEIRKLIKELSGSSTILFSSHVLHEVNELANRVIILDNGKTIADDFVNKLNNRLLTSIQIQVKIEGPSGPVIEEIKKIAGVINIQKREETSTSDGVNDLMIEASKAIDIEKELWLIGCRNHWIIRQMKTTEMDLENIVIKLMVNGNGT